ARETCSITRTRGTTPVLGATLSLAGFAPSTTGRFSTVHRGEGAPREDGADRLDDLGIAVQRLRPRLTRGLRGSHRRGRRIHARPRHAIHRTDHGQRIRPLGARAHPTLHRPRLFHSSAKPFYESSRQPPRRGSRGSPFYSRRLLQPAG